MNICITGGAGFIGSHIAKRLLKEGHKVWIIDDLSTGYMSNVPKEAIFLLANVTYPASYRYLLKDIDVVFHNAASKKNICLNNPEYDLDVNGKATLQLLRECKKAGVKKFIHASTGSVYGEVDGVTNEDTICNPVSYYGVSKLAGDRYVNMFSSVINTTILRYFHVYGDNQENDPDLGGVVAIFQNNKANGVPIAIHGDGNQRRCFTHVDNVVDANIKAMELESGGVYNVASGYYTSINELADMIGGEKIMRPALPGDIYNFDIDNSKVLSLGIDFKRIDDYICNRNKKKTIQDVVDEVNTDIYNILANNKNESKI